MITVKMILMSQNKKNIQIEMEEKPTKQIAIE